MVTGSDTIKLELVVDRAAMEQQLGEVFDTGGAPPSGRPDGKPVKVDAAGDMKQALGYLTRLTGITLGITALVRGSQVMSTTVGALNTTLFALVDSFLAPLAPYLIKLVELATKLFPAAEAGGISAKEKLDVAGFMLGGERPAALPEEVSKPDVALEMLRRAFVDLPMVFGEAFNKNIQVILRQREEGMSMGEVIGELNRRSAERWGMPGAGEPGVRRVLEDPEKGERLQQIMAGRQIQREEMGGPTYNISVYGTDTEDAVRKIREELESKKRLGITRTPGGR